MYKQVDFGHENLIQQLKMYKRAFNAFSILFFILAIYSIFLSVIVFSNINKPEMGASIPSNDQFVSNGTGSASDFPNGL